MDLGLDERRAAVAAGTAGLGYAIAAALLDEGCEVVVCGRDPDRLEQAVDSLGDGASGVVADLSTPEGGVAFARAAADELGGPPEIVIANAGGPPPGSPSETDIDAYRAALELNCLSSIALINATVPAMRAAGWGRILAVTSIGARQPIPFLAASSVARAAVTSFIKTLSVEIARDGVTANTLQPGTHDTDRVAKLAESQRGDLLRDIPAGRLGRPQDFGAVAAFLCSEQAGFITGASLVVDGGASRGLQ
jgi:3-oxoacyl-[acyl-carrier protein] reductase